MRPTEAKPSWLSVIMSNCLATAGGVAFVLRFLPTCRENREIVEVYLPALAIGAIGVIAIPAGVVARKIKLRQPELVVITLLYLSSFVLPSFYNEESFVKSWPAWDGTTAHYLQTVSPVSGPGLSSYVGSFFSLMIGNPVFFANPLCWFGIYMLLQRRWVFAAVLAFFAVSLGYAGGFVLTGKHIFDIGPGTLMFKLRSGYFVLLSSIFLVGASAAVRWIISARNTVTPEVEQC